MTTREKLTQRHYLPQDYPALAEVANAANIALGNERRVTAEELATYFDQPDFHPETDSFILEDDGRIVGMSDLEFSAETGRCYVDSAVHPDYVGQGIGTELIRLNEARCTAWAESTLAPDVPVSIQRFTVETNTRSLRLFEAHGYTPIRTFYRMRIELDQPIDAPPLPGGLVLRPFDEERDTPAVYEAHLDAFADHWGWDAEPYEAWVTQVVKHPQNDLALWLLAYDGDEIAGICLNRAAGGDDPHLAWVGMLGVRRPWRKQGVGEALLRTSFARFQAEGYERAGLMVDASSLTNAVALYERAGMHVQMRTLVYRKMLRGTFPEGE